MQRITFSPFACLLQGGGEQESGRRSVAVLWLVASFAEKLGCSSGELLGWVVLGEYPAGFWGQVPQAVGTGFTGWFGGWRGRGCCAQCS